MFVALHISMYSKKSLILSTQSVQALCGIPSSGLTYNNKTKEGFKIDLSKSMCYLFDFVICNYFIDTIDITF